MASDIPHSQSAMEKSNSLLFETVPRRQQTLMRRYSPKDSVEQWFSLHEQHRPSPWTSLILWPSVKRNIVLYEYLNRHLDALVSPSSLPGHFDGSNTVWQRNRGEDLLRGIGSQFQSAQNPSNSPLSRFVYSRAVRQDHPGALLSAQRSLESPRAVQLLKQIETVKERSNELVREEVRLHPYSVALFSLLRTYGITCTAPSTHVNANSSGQTSSSVSTNTSILRPPSGARESHRPVRSEQGDSDSDVGEQPPSKRPRERVVGADPRFFACPFYKLNPVLYISCERWRCRSNRIETIKRHVLGKQHKQSAHMNEVTDMSIRGLGVFKGQWGSEERWKAIYAKLAGNQPGDSNIPSPYHEILTSEPLPDLLMPAIVASPFIPPPSDVTVQLQDERPPPPPMISDAAVLSYLTELARIREQFKRRRTEIHQQTTARIHAQTETAREEETQLLNALEAEELASVHNLVDRLEQGLPATALDAEASSSSSSSDPNKDLVGMNSAIPLLSPSSLNNDANPGLPPIEEEEDPLGNVDAPPAIAGEPWEEPTDGVPPTDRGSRSEGNPPPAVHEPLPPAGLRSVSDDSGYNTLPHDHSPCEYCDCGIWCGKEEHFSRWSCQFPFPT